MNEHNNGQLRRVLIGGASMPALVLSLGIMVLYLPGSPAALLWPQEWLLFAAWMTGGFVLFMFARLDKGAA